MRLRLIIVLVFAVGGAVVGYGLTRLAGVASAEIPTTKPASLDATAGDLGIENDAETTTGIVQLDCPESVFDQHRGIVAGSDAFLEQRLQWLLEDYDVPEGAIVVIEPKSGALLAAAAHAEPDSERREIAFAPKYLAASIFKVVSAAALLERGLKPSTQICYRGGKRGFEVGQLDDSSADTACTDMASALARSSNVPFGKWADRLLRPQRLARMAQSFGLHSVQQGEQSCFGTYTVPTDRLGFAKMAAGFGEVRLSAWHAAQMIATVANDGLLPSVLVEAGAPQPVAFGKDIAQQLESMLAKTITEGTARRMFHDRGHYVLGKFAAAGKTGSLVEGEGQDWGEVTWFVGYAPLQAPQVAVAAVLVNSPNWRIRASYAGREALRTALLRSEPYRPTQDKVQPHRAKSHKKKRRRR